MAKFCSACGTALEAGDRFCTSCGAVVGNAAVTAAPAEAAPAASPQPATRARSSLLGSLRWEIVLGLIVGAVYALLSPSATRASAFATGFAATFVAVLAAHVVLSVVARILKPLAVVLAILLLVGGTASAASYYVAAPDMPPGGPLKALNKAVKPLLGALDRPQREPNLSLAIPEPPRRPAATPAVPPQQARIDATLRATGLPITSVGVVKASDGKQRLLVGLSAERLMSGSVGSLGLDEGLRAVVTMVQNKQLDLNGIDHVMTVVADEQGRSLVAISASTSAIVAFRDGKMARLDFLKSTAFKVESRQGVIDAVQRQVR